MKLFNSLKMNAETRLMAIAEEVIAEHSAPILEALGMTEDNDGILDKITASTEVTPETPGGVFVHQQMVKGFMGMHGVSYVKGSGSIVLYPLTGIYSQKKDGMKKVWFASAFSLLFSWLVKKHLTFILAHELRHYWQYYTGTVYKQGDYVGSTRFTPYSMRWEEIDANNWAIAYTRKKKK